MKPQNLSYRKLLLVTIGVVAAVFILTYLLSTQWGSIGNAVEQTAKAFGLPGLFIASIIANATILLPVPIDLVVFFVAGENLYGFAFLDPLVVALAVGLGAAIGEMSGYVIGLFGVKSIEKMKRKEIKQIVEKEQEINKFGGLIVFLGALTPFPFDLVGIAAGLIKFDIRRFFFACLLGKILRYAIIGYAGMLSIDFLKTFFGLG